MKKFLLSAVILLAALTVQAQKSVKISPTLKVGMQKTYITRGEATTSGSAAADITGELNCKVDGKTADGYQISMVSKSTNIDANQIMQSLTTPDLMQMLNSIRVELLTDKKGAVTAIGNSEEVLGKCMAVIDSMFNATIAKGYRVLATTLTKKNAESLTDYLHGLDIRVPLDENHHAEEHGHHERNVY